MNWYKTSMIKISQWEAIHFTDLFSDRKRGFIPPTSEDLINSGILKSDSGLVWLLPTDYASYFEKTEKGVKNAVRVIYPVEPKLLNISEEKDDINKKFGLEPNAFTGDKSTAKTIAQKIREMGYDGFRMIDGFPEIAILDTVPHTVKPYWNNNELV